MASKTTGDDETKPPLVCAPCWICLEQGPDEAGEPLIRDCACRGETSAGYHLSCIIDYAKVKLFEAIRKRERGPPLKPRGLTINWMHCPNCNQPYENIGIQLAKRMVELTEHLPETHYVRYEARIALVGALFYSQKELQLAEIEIEKLLQILRDNTSDLALSMYGEKEERALARNTVLPGESARLFRLLGAVKYDMGEQEYALQTFEKALKYLDLAQCFGYNNIDERRRIVHRIKLVQDVLGLRPPKDVVRESRETLIQLQNTNADASLITVQKLELAVALTKVDPPEYFEAIQLMNEVVAETQRTYGPDNEFAETMRRELESYRKKYRECLQEMAAAKRSG